MSLKLSKYRPSSGLFQKAPPNANPKILYLIILYSVSLVILSIPDYNINKMWGIVFLTTMWAKPFFSNKIEIGFSCVAPPIMTKFTSEMI